MRHSVNRLTLALIHSLLMIVLLASAALAADPFQRRIKNERGNEHGTRTNDQAPASALVYNLYTSDPNNSEGQDTQFTITNTHPSESVNVHLFLIDGSNCATLDAFACLTPNQTTRLLASEIDPGITGYAIFFAVNANGCPISFNHLIGSESVKLASGLTGSFNAEGFLALYNGALPGCSGNDATATLALDGKVYTAPASKLALDSISSVVDGASTTLVVNSLSGSLITGMSALGQLSGVLYDDVENGFSFGATGACQLNRILSDDFPKTIPLFSQVIPTKRSGWLSIMTREEKAISGAVINFNPNAATTKGVFNNSHNLHHLSHTSANIVVPVFPVSCS